MDRIERGVVWPILDAYHVFHVILSIQYSCLVKDLNGSICHVHLEVSLDFGSPLSR